jgi:hypothetical protein
MPNPIATLTITLNDDASVGVNGPIENRMLVYGMLEMAKDAVTKFAEKSQNKVIEVPPGTVLRKFPTAGA